MLILEIWVYGIIYLLMAVIIGQAVQYDYKSRMGYRVRRREMVVLMILWPLCISYAIVSIMADQIKAKRKKGKKR